MGMTVDQWIQVLLLGGIAGLIGQLVRVAVGLKKQNDEAAEEGQKLGELLVPSRMVVSLMFGFAAGALSAIAIGLNTTDTFEAEKILSLAAAGYAGADFIEGFASRFLPGGVEAKASKSGESGTASNQTHSVG